MRIPRGATTAALPLFPERIASGRQGQGGVRSASSGHEKRPPTRNGSGGASPASPDRRKAPAGGTGGLRGQRSRDPPTLLAPHPVVGSVCEGARYARPRAAGPWPAARATAGRPRGRVATDRRSESRPGRVASRVSYVYGRGRWLFQGRVCVLTDHRERWKTTSPRRGRMGRAAGGAGLAKVSGGAVRKSRVLRSLRTRIGYTQREGTSARRPTSKKQYQRKKACRGGTTCLALADGVF